MKDQMVHWKYSNFLTVWSWFSLHTLCHLFEKRMFQLGRSWFSFKNKIEFAMLQGTSDHSAHASNSIFFENFTNWQIMSLMHSSGKWQGFQRKLKSLCSWTLLYSCSNRLIMVLIAYACLNSKIYFPNWLIMIVIFKGRNLHKFLRFVWSWYSWILLEF